GTHLDDLVPPLVVPGGEHGAEVPHVDQREHHVEPDHRPDPYRGVVPDQHQAAQQVEYPQPEQPGLQQRPDQQPGPDPADHVKAPHLTEATGESPDSMVVRTTRPVAVDLLPHLRRARDHIDRHYRAPLDLDQLAAVAQVSKFHFVRSFEAAYGE